MKLPPIASAVPITVSPAGDSGSAARPAGAQAATVYDPARHLTDPAVLQQVAEALTQHIGTAGQNLQFSVDRDTGKTVLRVTDAESGTLLRQIPGDEALAIARILDRMQGMLIRQKA